MSSHWTPTQIKRARWLLKQRAHDSVFRTEFGKSKKAAEECVRRADNPPPSKPVVPQARKPANSPTLGERVDVPERVMADRARRAMIEQSPIARLLGEPMPGYSALDRKQSAGASA